MPFLNMGEQPCRARAEQQMVQEFERVLLGHDVVLHGRHAPQELIDECPSRLVGVLGQIERVAWRVGNDLGSLSSLEALRVDRLPEHRVHGRADEQLERQHRRELQERRRRRHGTDIADDALQLRIDALRFTAAFEKTAGDPVERRPGTGGGKRNLEPRRELLRQLVVQGDRRSTDIDRQQLLPDDRNDGAVVDVLEQALPQVVVSGITSDSGLG